jgi:hypothetical protein
VDSVLPALLVVTVMLLASLMIGRSSITSFQVLGDAWIDAEERSVERVRSDIAVSSVTASSSMSGTTDVVVSFSATTAPGDYVQTGDGQLTVFMVNQDTNATLRADDISVTITTDTGSTVYDFTGITSPSSSHTAEDGEIDVSDTVIANGTFGARRNTIAGWSLWGEASTAEYGNLVGSNDLYYQGVDPGSGDNAAMIFEFYITETPADITQIDVQVEGAQGAAVDAWFAYLWNYSGSTYAVCCSDIDITVQNDGATPVVDFSRMDMVVQYTTGGGIVLNTYANFTIQTSPQPSDSWQVLSITDDVIDPSILNTGESMNIEARLFPALGVSTSNWVQMTTELGISASSFFTD